MIYPEHIYAAERRELAQQLMTKEFSKLFPSVASSVLQYAISDWHDNPSNYHLEDGIRDHWDTFSALFEQVKLKPGFTHMFTAENFTWTREMIDVGSIQLTSPLEQITRIPGMKFDSATTVGSAIDLAKAASVVDEQRHINDTFSSEAQDAYPIIVRTTVDGKHRVMDGNRRALRAGLYNKSTIDAWVGSSKDEFPKDFWVPAGELYQLVRYYRVAQNSAQRQAARNMLETLFCFSSIARITYDTRIANESEAAAEFLAMKPTI